MSAVAAGGPRVAVVGAGWAGLAAACEAVRRGAALTLYEASAQAGGRARSLVWRQGPRPLTVDNGQHLLVGAYRETLALIECLGGRPEALFTRLPLSLARTDGVSLRAARLPAPWHLALGLLGARGLPWRARFDSARLLASLRRSGWVTDPGLTVEQLLDRCRQGEPARELLWRPLCVSALNTRSFEASARVFAAVVRDTLGARAADSDFLVPAVPLSELLPGLTLPFLARHGAEVRLRTAVRALARTPRGLQLATADGYRAFDAVVLAVPPPRAAALIGSLTREARDPTRTRSGERPACPGFSFDYRPITTVYLRWPGRPHRLPALVMLPTEPRRGWHGQWLFGHRLADGGSLAAVVISADGPHRRLGRSELAQACVAQLRANLGLPDAEATLVLDEKRATFACTPELRRPPLDMLAGREPGLWLAGDYVDSEYPATLEAAVRSGLAAGARAAAA
ncbi:MAG: FAD-dependent oxidoreductase [Burkholderiales bacterium]|nr:MAG: FAD-dependent oxidoreductase [Burkholderiales bacterium]